MTGLNCEEKMNEYPQVMETQNNGENLLLRRTQGDLLQKLRQLQQWRQQKEENLLQDKEKQMSLLRDKERRLQAVQEYQRKILQSNSLVLNGTANFETTNRSPVLSSPLQFQPDGNLHHPVKPVLSPPFLVRPDDSSQYQVNQEKLSASQCSFQVRSDEISQLPDKSVTSPPHQVKLADFPEGVSSRPVFGGQPNMNVVTGSQAVLPVLQPPSRSVLLSPQHFKAASNMNASYVPVSTNSQMLLTQKLQLPSVSDEELTQFTESDGGSSIAGIEGVRPIEDSPSEGSESVEDVRADETDFEDENNDTLKEEDFAQQDDGNVLDIDVNLKPNYFDDIPIKPGLGAQTQTFEELLNQQLQAEKREDTKHEELNRPKTSLSTKRTFLRKGEGIARFGMKVVAKQQTVLKERNLKTKPQNAPVTRKTTTVKQTATLKDLHCQPMLGQKQPFSPKKVEFSTGNVHDEQRSESGSETAGEIKTTPEVIIEDSFQERLKMWDEREVVEKQELNEFELLEEAAAANCSLSSNSSTVLRILGKKQQQHQADVNNNMLEFRQKWNAPSKGAEPVGGENDGNRTLTEETSDNEDNDTLKDPEVVSVRSSLALSDGFDDSKTWEDHDGLDVSGVTNDVMLALNTSTPDDKCQRRNSQTKKEKLVNSSSTPPTSALVTKFFPQLKTTNEVGKIQAAQKHLQSEQMHPPATDAVKVDAAASSGTDGGLSNGMSSAVRHKLQELEKEIEKFREENIALHRLREEREKDLHELQKERTLFENYKTEELDRLEKFKTEEEKRLRRDKRVFEQYQKASRALPDRKERDEITSLKAKINELQEDLKLRESRWSAAAIRYKDRISNLEKDNKELREEVKLLEKQNLDLQRKEQQKIRELQQYKAFEKRKLKKPEGISTKKSPTASEPRLVENVSENSLLKKQTEQVSDSRLSHPLPKNVSPSNGTTYEHIVSVEPPQAENIHEDESSDKSSAVPVRLGEYSSPTKQTNSSKSVRFKDDSKLEEKERPETTSKQLSRNDGKREVVNPDGSRVVTFTNGTRKEISADGQSVVVTFFNGDIKQIFPDERVEYYYAEVQTTHTTYPDGLEVLRFPSNQIEKHYPDGTKEIIFPDQTVKYLYTSGAEECVFTDGTVERISVDGGRVVEFPNGQRETYTKLFKKREYPDGTVKTVYTDGRQETRYASGRLRVKDSEGRLLVDTSEHTIQMHQSEVS